MKNLLLLLITFLIISSGYTTASSQNKVVVHHSVWAPSMLPANGTFNWTGITHLILFGMEVHSGLPGSYYLSMHSAYSLTWGQAITAEAHSHGVKVLLCTGGIARGGDWLRNIAPNPSFRRTVVNAHVNYAVNVLGADGIDLDWESEVDGSLWTALSIDYRQALDAVGSGKILAADIGREPSNAWPIATINQYYDMVQPMLYDADGWYGDYTGFHNSLYDPRQDYPSIAQVSANLCADSCMKRFERAGIIKSKVALGLSFYPHVFSNNSPALYAPGQACYVNRSSVPFPAREGLGAFNESVYPKLLAGATENYAPHANMAWIGSASGNYYMNYQNARSYAAFNDYIRANGWGGAMLFAQEHQYFQTPVEWPIGSGVFTRTPLLDDFRASLAPPTPSAPLFSLHPLNRTVLVGEQASFTVQVSGYPTPTYQWQRNGVNISGATSISYTIPAAAVADNGATFRCIATNSQGSATSTSATLTVSVPTPSAPSFLVQPANKTVLVGGQASFTVQVAGYPIPTYQWQRNDVNMSGATSISYTIPAAAVADNGATFRCIATNSQGVATSSAATLTVSTPQVANPTSDDFSSTARFTNLWSKSHPTLTSLVGLGTTDALLRLNVDGSTAHEMGNNDYSAVRVLQDITNGNFEVVTKYQTLPSATYQWEGILVKENAASFLRFDILKDNSGLKFYAGTASASSQLKILTSITLSGPSAWVKVNRTGDVWTASYSSDGSTFTQAGQFTQAMVVDSIGVYAGNQSGGSGVPAFDCKVDYFFNVVSPINPEDPITGAPTGSLGVSNDSLPSGGGNVTLTWTSNAAVSASIDQGIGTVSLNGSMTVAVGQTKSFVLTLTNAVGSQSYTARVFVASPSVAPTGSLSVSSDSLPAGGGNVTLTWTSNAAVSASIDQGIGNVTLNGSANVVVTQTKSFILTLTNAVGSQSYVARVFVASPPGSPTGSLSVSSDSLPAGGGTVILTWTSSAALSASFDQGIGNVTLNGSTMVAVGQTKSFTLTLTNAAGSQSYVASVIVALPGGSGNLQDITSTGYPVAFITNPTGSGNRNLEIIRDGIAPPQGSSNPNEQYDTYNGGGTRLVDWIGYTYSSTHSFGSLILQEGIHASAGGFFSSTPRVEIRVGAQWIEAQGLTITPAYGAGSASNFTMYTLNFNATTGDGVRVAGTPGGTSRYLSIAELRVMGTATSTVPPDNRPKDYDLLSNYPNPFNPSTTIEFWVPATSHVTLSIYNILGQKVRTLVDQPMDNGKWPVTWNGRDDQNRLMSSGIYIYKMQAGDFVATRKMILSK